VIDTFDGEDGEEYEASNFGGFADYFRRKKLKLQNRDADIRASSAENPPIFRGVVAHVNGYTQPSLNDLHRLIVSHGGGFLQYLDGKTTATHIIASSLTPKKREEFRRYRIVKPSWIVESVQAGCLLPWDSYRVVDEGQSQRVLRFENGTLQSEVNDNQQSYKDQTDGSWYTSQIKDAIIDAQNAPALNLSRPKFPQSQASNPNLSAETDYGDFPTLETPPDPVREDTVTWQEDEQKTASMIEVESIGGALSEPAVNTSSVVEDTETSVPPQLVRDTIPVRPDMTPEEYNALLLSDPRMRKSSVVNPEFVQQFYKESRLHHLSTWKAELKAKFQAATQEKAQNQPNMKRRILGARRYILHVDFDSFFAAVSIQKHHPELIDKPVAIAHGTGNGSEIASCNYPARAFGIKNGMWMKGAIQQCAELKVLPYDFDAYEEASRHFYDCILAVDGIVQSVSIDEALVDITTQCLEAGGSDGRGISEGSLYREQAKAGDVAQHLRATIKERTGCAVSVGIGGNILQAKVALRKAKPAGQFQLKPDDVLDFIGNLTVQDLPGVAYSLGGKLEEIGVKFVKDLRDLSRERLISSLGPKTGVKLWDYARGIDKTEVGVQSVRKSVSAEINWGIRFVNQGQAEEFVQSLSDELHRRLVENLVKGKQLTIRVMRRSADAPLEPVKHLGHGKCDVFNKSVMLGVATNASDVVGKEAIAMLRSFAFSPGDLRGLGVQMTKLEPVKSADSGRPESSQQQLNFKASPVTKKAFQDIDPDLLESPHKGDATSLDAAESLESRPSLGDQSHKRLNTSGTQFVMQAQLDPTVVAELPGDIRSKLIPKSHLRNDSRDTSPSPVSRNKLLEPAVLPPQSQLDPDILDALPEDVRAEILGFYSNSSVNDRPQPVHAPSAATVKKAPTPTKKRRGRPPKSKFNSTLTQSSFNFNKSRAVEPNTATSSRQASPSVHEAEEISQDFLAALPEDIRREVLEEQRQAHLQQRSNLNLPPSRKLLGPRPATPTDTGIQTDDKCLPLPPLPEKPTFTSRKLSTLPFLREAVAAWHSTFASDGPFVEDVKALAKYLSRVILEERDMEKAVSVANWLGWLIGDGNHDNKGHPHKQSSGTQPESSQVDMSWEDALKLVQDSVTDAVKERGLPPVEFSD
jgi:DNA repair protein REV1